MHVSKEAQLAMTWDMLGTVFSGALAPGYVRRGQRHNPPIRDDGLRSREHAMATWGYPRLTNQSARLNAALVRPAVGCSCAQRRANSPEEAR